MTFRVVTVRDEGRIRVHALAGQYACGAHGRRVPVDPHLWVAFPGHLRTAAGLFYRCESLALVASGGRQPFYRAGGRIWPTEVPRVAVPVRDEDLYSPAPTTAPAATVALPPRADVLRPERALRFGPAKVTP